MFSRRVNAVREIVPFLSQSGTCLLLLLPRTIPNYALSFFLLLSFFFVFYLLFLRTLVNTGWACRPRILLPGLGRKWDGKEIV